MIGPVPLESINDHFNRRNNSMMNINDYDDDDDNSNSNSSTDNIMNDIELSPTPATIVNLTNAPPPRARASNTNNSNSNNNLPRTNRELWIEHERRQRTIRFLMMFLMMLILMDGEQSANEELKRKHDDNYLRKKRHYGSGNGGNNNINGTNLIMDDNGNLVSISELLNGDNNHLHGRGYFNKTLPEELYMKRKTLDDSIRLTYSKPNSIYSRTKTTSKINKNKKEQQKHPRIQHLFELNNGTDEESNIWNWAINELDQELSAERKSNDNNDNSNKNKNNNDDLKAKEINAELEKESKREVFHYPRNATGHFRGYWTRISTSSSSSSSAPTTTKLSSSSLSIAKTPKSSSHPTSKDITFTKTMNTTNSPIIYTKPKQIKDAILYDTARTFPISDSLGVYILPQHTQMYGWGKEQLDLFHMNDDDNDNSQFGKMYYNKTSTQYEVKMESSSSTIEPLYITEEEGKLHFHFYTRSIAGMKEISLIDGYIKIRDINDYGFLNTKKHLFVRVHGVIIHSIGKISLTANEGVFRSAFVLFNEDDDGNGVGLSENDDVDVSKLTLMDDSGTSSNIFGGDANGSSATTVDSNERRQLQESIGELTHEDMNSSDDDVHVSRTATITATFQKQISDIRDRALFIYSELFHQKYVGGHGWNLFTSNDDDMKGSERELNLDFDFQHYLQSQDDRNDGRRLSEKEIGKDDNKESVGEDTSIQHWAETSTQPYPYIPYNKDVLKISNKALFEKAYSNIHEPLFNKDCQFEINLDVNATQWMVYEWRHMAKRIVFGINYVNPFAAKKQGNQENIGDEFIGISPYVQSHDEALVMYLSGTMESANCDFAMHVNATAFRIDWEETKFKASIYSVYMMLASLAQIVVLLRQLIHGQSQMATRVSMLCIGWQTILDAILCFEHVLLCLMVPPVSTAFFMVALFKFLLFYVIEMKYMVMIMEARSSAAGLPNNASEIRRRLAKLQLSFFSALFIVIIAFWYLIFGQFRRKLVFMIMYSFWVPQIVYNIFTEARRPLHKHYIYGNSITRLNLPLILFGIPRNFLQVIEPEFPMDFKLCTMLIVWVGIQTALLVGQGKYGARFMIPARFLPPKYDYSRPIPKNLLPRQLPSSRTSSEDSDTAALLENDVINETGTRNRKEKRSRNTDGNGTITMHEENEERQTIDCVICHNPIDILDKKQYMIAPCDHIFHKSCLEQWMDVKMECPICRTNLPGL